MRVGVSDPRIARSGLSPIRLAAACIGCGLLLAACAGCVSLPVKPPPPEARTWAARQIAVSAGWEWQGLYGVAGRLQTALNGEALAGTSHLTVYIEGDGLAWLNPSTPSSDPTPANPLALKLAVQHIGPAAYLARPCQFGSKYPYNRCAPLQWTSHRFSEDSIDWMNSELSRLKALSGAATLRLIGYSGGAAVALILAARREDVNQVTTVAGLFNTNLWSQTKMLAPLTGSLNPADEWEALERTPQVHWVGARDNVVPIDNALQFIALFPENKRPTLHIVEEFDHHCCWEMRWGSIQNTGDLATSDQ